MERDSLPPTARLTWLVGPPGAGKSTFAQTTLGEFRVVEFGDMLGPLINPPRIRKGVLTAHGQLVQLIRALERHPDNRALAPVIAVAGMVPEEVLFPLADDEIVWLLRPDRARWETQLRRRPPGGGTTGQYDDYAYSEIWYERFASWVGRERVYSIEVPFRADLVGRVCGALPADHSGGGDGS